jgi:regulator of sirC expression with transglutaminase-like and TPR domain
MSATDPMGDDPAILQMQTDILRRMSPEQRLQIVADLNRTVDAMAEAGIRSAFPDASDREVFLRLAVRKLGYQLARTAYPEVDALEGVRG